MPICTTALRAASLLMRFQTYHPYPAGAIPLYNTFTTTATTHQTHEDLFRYTSGRWLWNEAQELRDRYTPFNVSELQKVAARTVGATECISITKLGEGSFNKAFKLTMDDGKTVIAKIPHPIAGPDFSVTASEVATMDFARTVLEIPVPEVYAWCTDRLNPVGSEYILMQEAPGVKLENVWESLPLKKKVEIMKELVSIEKKMLSAPLSKYGSLYFAADNVPGAITADIVGKDVKDNIRQRFSIGPVASREYWKNERAKMKLNRGPWTKPQEYITSIARRELAWIQEHAKPRPKDDPLLSSPSQNSPTSHISLLEKFLKVAPFLLPDDPAITAPHIWHTDLHGGNIFIDQRKISSIIDWQGTCAEPLILRARHARLVDYNGELMLKAPANFQDLNSDEKQRIREQVSRSIILYLYEKEIMKEAPLFDRVLRLEHGRTRQDPIHFVGDTWDDDILPFRESLIRVERNWSKLGLGAPCPIHFHEDELWLYAQEGDGWNEVQDFWDALEGIVSRDGWTTNDGYENAVSLFIELRESGLKNMVGKEMEEFKRQTDWVGRP